MMIRRLMAEGVVKRHFMLFFDDMRREEWKKSAASFRTSLLVLTTYCVLSIIVLYSSSCDTVFWSIDVADFQNRMKVSEDEGSTECTITIVGECTMDALARRFWTKAASCQTFRQFELMSRKALRNKGIDFQCTYYEVTGNE